MSLKRIMIVDDETSFTRMLKLNLEQTGRYQVHEANTGFRILKQAREFRPDLILLDVIMPGMDGGELFNHLHADPQLKDTPIAFLTATVGRREAAKGGLHSGGMLFLAKPVGLEELIAFIEEHTPASGTASLVHSAEQ